MALVLVIGSHAAGSRVGGTAASLALALSPQRIDPLHVPTTVLGRHPGWGPPGGGAVGVPLIEGMLEGIAANGLFELCNAVLTGYHASPEQVAVTASAITALKAVNPHALVMVDPVMGDHPAGLYVSEETARAITEQLVPLADVLTPNAFELERLTGLPTQTPAQAARACRATLKPCIATSVDAGEGRIGMVAVTAAGAWLASHERIEAAPKGTGDTLAALVLAAMLEGSSLPRALDAAAILPAALAQAAGTMRALMLAARDWSANELPLVGALGHGGIATGAPPLPLTPIPD